MNAVMWKHITSSTTTMTNISSRSCISSSGRSWWWCTHLLNCKACLIPFASIIKMTYSPTKLILLLNTHSCVILIRPHYVLCVQLLISLMIMKNLFNYAQQWYMVLHPKMYIGVPNYDIRVKHNACALPIAKTTWKTSGISAFWGLFWQSDSQTQHIHLQLHLHRTVYIFKAVKKLQGQHFNRLWRIRHCQQI